MNLQVAANAEATSSDIHVEKKRSAAAAIGATSGKAVRLAKDTSNLFRERLDGPDAKLDLRAFDSVLDVDTEARIIDTEAMVTYEALVRASLAHGVLPAVVPELKSITIGGAVSGLGIEASSFRYGLAHETVQEMEVLLADGDIVVCTPDNDHADLFFGLPNSFGTLGYVLRVKTMAIPVRDHVHLTHLRYSDPDIFFRDLGSWCDGDVDFLEGVVFGPDEMYLSIGRFSAEAPYVSDYTHMNIYYRSIRDRDEDYLTTSGFIWRWDTDWFWCSRHLFVQNPVVRRLFGKDHLNSTTYKKIVNLTNNWSLLTRINRIRGLHTETVIQDVDVPLDQAPGFLDFFQREIGLTPIWICPVRRYDPAVTFDLVGMKPRVVYVNFGFWDAVTSPTPRPEGYFNRLIERKIAEMDGFKSLYSDAYYGPGEFHDLYNGTAYDRLKAKYDPNNRLKSLYEKCVLRR